MFVGIATAVVVTAAIQLDRRIKFLDVVEVVSGTVNIQQIGGLGDLLNVGNQLGSASVSDGGGGGRCCGGGGAVRIDLSSGNTFLGWTDGG